MIYTVYIISLVFILLNARIHCNHMIGRVDKTNFNMRHKHHFNLSPILTEPSLHTTNNIINIRGGKRKQEKKASKSNQLKTKPGPTKAIKDTFAQVYPATRVYLLGVLLCTIVHLTGAPAPIWFALDRSKLIEIWRPLTSIAYLGAPSMSMATSLYFLIRYGQGLESETGTGAHAWFLIIQTIILTILGLLMRFPFQAQAMIAATVYTSSHLNPMEKIPFQFGLLITTWQLPFCSMIIDILSQQSIVAAWPHVMGIFSGHIYYFFSKIWPELGGKAWLAPPKWLVKKLGEKKSNIRGVDFSQKEPIPSTRRRASKSVKGRKLGEA